MDQLKTKMQGSDESQWGERMEELMPIPQQVAQETGKEDTMKVPMSIWSGLDPALSKEYTAAIVKKMQQVAQYDIKTNILYSNALANVKRVQLFLETNSDFTDDKTLMHDTVEIMKTLGKTLKARKSMREQLDVLIMYHIKNLMKKKDADIGIIEEVNEKIKHLHNSNGEVQMETQLHQIKQTKKHDQREQEEGKKRKEILFLEDDQVQQKKKKIAQSGMEKNFSAANEGHLRGEPSHGFFEQLETMQQRVQQLRTYLLLREENQQTLNKNKIMGSTMQEFKLMRNQEKKAKRQ